MTQFTPSGISSHSLTSSHNTDNTPLLYSTIHEQYTSIQLYYTRAIYLKNNQPAPVNSTDASPQNTQLIKNIITTTANLQLCLIDINNAITISEQLLNQYITFIQSSESPSDTLHNITNKLKSPSINRNRTLSPRSTPSRTISSHEKLVFRHSHDPHTNKLILPSISHNASRVSSAATRSNNATQQLISDTSTQLKPIIAFSRSLQTNKHSQSRLNTNPTYTLFVQLQCKHTWLLYLRSIVYYELHEYQQCIDDCTSIIQIDTGFTPAYKYRSICYIHLKQYTHAISDLQYYTSMKSNHLGIVLQLALLYIHTLDYNNADILLKRINKLIPNNVYILYCYSIYYMQQQQYDDAYTQLQHAERIDSTSCIVQWRLAEVCERLCIYEQALIHCKLAQQYNTEYKINSIDLLFIECRLYIYNAQYAYKRLNELITAEQQLIYQRNVEYENQLTKQRNAAGNDDDNSDTEHNTVEQHIHNNQHIVTDDKLIDSNVPITSTARLCMRIASNVDNKHSTLQYIHQQLQLAFDVLTQYNAINSNNVDIHCLIAYVLLFIYGNRHYHDSNDMVCKHINTVLQLNDQHCKTLYLYAIVLLRQGDSDGALVQLNKLLQLQPEHINALQLLSNIQFTSNDYASSYNTLTHAIQLSNSHPTITHTVKSLLYSNRGVARLLTHDVDGALSDIEHSVALSSYPTMNPLLLLHRAECYKQMGLVQKAIDDYRVVINTMKQILNDTETELKQYQLTQVRPPSRQLSHSTMNTVYGAFSSSIHGPEHYTIAAINDTYRYNCIYNIDISDIECVQNSLGIMLHKQDMVIDDEIMSCFTDSTQHYQARYNRGLVYLQKNQLNIALNEFKSAVDSNPNYADARNNYGVVLERSAQIDQAVIHYAEAVRLSPMHTIAPFNLANVHLVNCQYNDAIQLYSTLLKRHEQIQSLGGKQSDHTNRSMELHAAELLTRESTDGDGIYVGAELVPLAWNNKAICYIYCHQYMSALECYNHGISYNNNLIFIYYNRAHLYIMLNNAYSALHDMQHAHKLLQQDRQNDPSRYNIQYIHKFIDYCKRYQWGLAVAVRDMIQSLSVLPLVMWYDTTVPLHESLFNPFVLDDRQSADYILLQHMLNVCTNDDRSFVELIQSALTDTVQQHYLSAHHSLVEATYTVPHTSIDQRALWYELLCIWRTRINVYLCQYSAALNDINIFVNQLFLQRYDRANDSIIRQQCNVRLLHYSGCLYQLNYSYDLALQSYNHVIQLNPQYIYTYINRAVVYQSIGKYTDCLHDISAVVNMLKNDSQYQFTTEQVHVVDLMQQCMNILNNNQHTDWSILHTLQSALLQSIHTVQQQQHEDQSSNTNRVMSARSKWNIAMYTAKQMNLKYD